MEKSTGETRATVLGLDIGTQSTKILLYDYENKKVVFEKSDASYGLISLPDGSREQKAQDWVHAVESLVTSVDQPLRKTVKAIGVSGQQHGFVPVDSSGNVLHNVKLWCDTSTSGQCKEIIDLYGSEDKLIDQVGNSILPGYTASKILWFKQNHPESFNRLHKVLLPHDYINYYLTGEFSMEYGDASGTGLLDIRKRTWNTDLIEIIDGSLIDKLPKLINADQICGYLKKDLALKLGLTPHIPVSSGGGDNMMSAIGTGATSEGKMTVSLGTSGTLFAYSDKPVIHKSLAAFCSSTNGWLPLLCTMNCTVGLELMKGLFDADISTVEELAESTSIGSNGVSVYPYYNGERTPNLPNAKGSIVGLTVDNMNQGNLVRASMEAAIYGIKHGLEIFQSLGVVPTEICITGGGAKSKTWRQICADILEVPNVLPTVGESAAFGAALQALWCLRRSSNPDTTIDEIVQENVSLCLRTHPNKESAQLYKTLYASYNSNLEPIKSLYSQA